jgi:hypothetical protein
MLAALLRPVAAVGHSKRCNYEKGCIDEDGQGPMVAKAAQLVAVGKLRLGGPGRLKSAALTPFDVPPLSLQT